MNSNVFNTKPVEEKTRLLESVFSQLIDLVFVYDLGTLEFIIKNPALERVFSADKISSGDISCSAVKNTIHPDDWHLVAQTLDKAQSLKDNDILSVETRLKKNNGDYVFFITRVSVFKRNDDGTVAQILGISQDISDKRKYEKQKQKNINTLKELSFITSHELRHEYAKIQSIIQLIDNKFIDEKERKVLLNEAKQSIQIINSTIFKINHKLSFNQTDEFYENDASQKPFQKIILVDDDALTNMLNKKIINAVMPEMPVEIFIDPDDALVFLQENDAHGDYLVFLDINFPYRNGWDFMEEYKKFAIKSKVIMLSSSIDNADRERARVYNEVIDYVTKPLSIDFAESILKMR